MKNSLTSTVKLSNGVEMPWFGLGTWKVDNLEDAKNSVRMALELGYRAVDTAPAYRNEKAVGEAIRESGIPREEIFITSKLSGENGYDLAYSGLESSLKLLGIDYLDLYLIHWPRPSEGRYVEAFKAMKELMDAGKIRAIGVSNFLPEHMERIHDELGIYPMVNQVECHPRYQQLELKKYCREKGVQLECYSPLINGQLATAPAIQSVLNPIAEKHGKNVFQICLRWQLDSDVVCISKSLHRERLAQNADIFDFELDAEDMAAIATLDNGDKLLPEPDHIFVPRPDGKRPDPKIIK